VRDYAGGGKVIYHKFLAPMNLNDPKQEI
jgi:hypothetical protein